MKFATIALIGAVQACDVTVKMFTDAECKTATEDAELKKAADTFSTAFTGTDCTKIMEKAGVTAAYAG